GTAVEQERIYNLYLKHLRHINNWDLVDSSAPQIIGAFLERRDRSILYKLSGSGSLWGRRIAIIATFYFIKQNDFNDALLISEQLLNDQEDLIHKAVGWMLREIGKRDMKIEKTFLKIHYQQMPRTMLRYAIEKFSPEERRQYLQGEI
ncbi:MAG: DNA alkylation repair protein, partial [Fidelibacterota bacterium]